MENYYARDIELDKLCFVAAKWDLQLSNQISVYRNRCAIIESDERLSKKTVTKYEISKETVTKFEISKETVTKLQISKETVTKFKISKETVTFWKISKKTAP